MIRETCGTVRGAIAHAAVKEPLCGWCLQAERVARIAAELITVPDRRPVLVFDPVTPEEAAEHCEELLRELDVFEAAHPEGHGTHWRVIDITARLNGKGAA